MSVPTLSSSMSISTLSSLSVSILCFPLCLSLFVTLLYLYFSPRCPLYLSPCVPFFFELGIGIDLVPNGHILRIFVSQGVGGGVKQKINKYIYMYMEGGRKKQKKNSSPRGVAYIYIFWLDLPPGSSVTETHAYINRYMSLMKCRHIYISFQ